MGEQLGSELGRQRFEHTLALVGLDRGQDLGGARDREGRDDGADRGIGQLRQQRARLTGTQALHLARGGMRGQRFERHTRLRHELMVARGHRRSAG